MAATATNSAITTVEGLLADTEIGDTARTISDVQAAFVTEGAVQCGFCTPGLIVAVHHLLEQNPSPSDIEVKEAISGNICRCTGYGRIFAAVNAVIETREKSK